MTAGPTWVAIDPVRVISNISSGATGISIASAAARKGARVTLLLGPTCSEGRGTKDEGRIKIKRFEYYDELKKVLYAELKTRKYDILIHVAAVADYKPVKTSAQKIRSGRQALKISLEPTEKLIDKVRSYDPGIFLVMFKLESGSPERGLIDIAYKNLVRAKADMVVANNLEGITKDKHRAYIIDSQGKSVPVSTKKELADRLLKIISEKI